MACKLWLQKEAFCRLIHRGSPVKQKLLRRLKEIRKLCAVSYSSECIKHVKYFVASGHKGQTFTVYKCVLRESVAAQAAGGRGEGTAEEPTQNSLRHIAIKSILKIKIDFSVLHVTLDYKRKRLASLS